MTPIVKAAAVLVIALLVAASVVLLVLEAGRIALQRKAGQRLKPADQPDSALARHGLIAVVTKRLVALTDKVKLKQRAASEQERIRFIQAGFRSAQAIRYFSFARTVLIVALPVLVLLVLEVADAAPAPRNLLLLLGAAAGGGYVLPGIFLDKRIASRAALVQSVLPDLVDLTVICTESGLALDQALARAVRELEYSSPVVAEEFQLAALEIRAGAGRAAALRNLAGRVKLEDLQSLTGVLIQADRFGTSIAEGLRVHSEVMRLKRSQRAEEIAARIPTIILIPLIFCILPALLLVIMGPAVLRLQAIM